MNISYDASSGFVYVSVESYSQTRMASSKILAPGVRADYDSEGRMLGVEIWGNAGNLKLVTR